MHQNHSSRKLVESLENRTLLSVAQTYITVEDGMRMLYVNGTNGNDAIKVYLTYNGTTGTGLAADVRIVDSLNRTFNNVNGVRVNLKGGNDSLSATSHRLSLMSNGNDGKGVTMHLVVNAGAGNDRISLDRYDGEIFVNGEGGNDIIDATHAFRGVSVIGDRSYRGLSGGTGNDRLIGSAYEDQLYGGQGRDILFGGNGDDFIYGEGGNDYISGGHGDDTLDGGTDRNTLSGGHGDDVFYIAPLQPLEIGAALNGGYDIVHGGRGNDTIVRWWNENIAPQNAWTYGTLWVSSVEKTIYGANSKG